VLAARHGAESVAPVSSWQPAIPDREPDFAMKRYTDLERFR
jgi:hypothetical protein